MLRTLKFSFAFLALALLAVPAQAQVFNPGTLGVSTGYGFGPYSSGYNYGGYGGLGYGYGFPGFGFGGTAAGNYLWGRSQVIQAQGQYNLDTSQAAYNLEAARAKELENESTYARTYFEKQKMNRDFREAHREPKANPEQLIRLAKAGAPGRPDRTQLDQPSGIILWPEALSTNRFEGYRKEMEKLYGERTATNYGTTSSMYGEVQRVASDMKLELKELIRSMDANEYLAARKFIDRLAYEARFAPAMQGVAAN